MRWGKMTARATFTMTEEHRERLRAVANQEQKSESKIVRNALDLYFEQLEDEQRGESTDMKRVSDV